MDGNTTVATMAADITMQRGIVVCTVMVNAGPGSITIHAPGDADSIIAYGAVYPTGEIAYFSSRGLTYDGRVKPAVCARGVSAGSDDHYNPNDNTTASGTSLSAPRIGGAAGLILSAHPECTPMQVREVTMMSGDHACFPHSGCSWGIPDIPTGRSIYLLSYGGRGRRRPG